MLPMLSSMYVDLTKLNYLTSFILINDIETIITVSLVTKGRKHDLLDNIVQKPSYCCSIQISQFNTVTHLISNDNTNFKHS